MILSMLFLVNFRVPVYQLRDLSSFSKICLFHLTLHSIFVIFLGLISRSGFSSFTNLFSFGTLHLAIGSKARSIALTFEVVNFSLIVWISQLLQSVVICSLDFFLIIRLRLVLLLVWNSLVLILHILVQVIYFSYALDPASIHYISHLEHIHSHSLQIQVQLLTIERYSTI